MKKFCGMALLLAWLPVAQADLESVRAAAQAGNAEAQLELGELYEFGFGLKDNAVPALAWYLAASRAGNERATERASVLTAKLTATQRQEAERMSREIKTVARAPEAPVPAKPPVPKPEPVRVPPPPAVTTPTPKAQEAPAPKPIDAPVVQPATPPSAPPISPAPKPVEDNRLGPG